MELSAGFDLGREEGGEAGRIVLKRPQSAAPKHLAALDDVQPLRPGLVAILALIGNRVDEHRDREPERVGKFARRLQALFCRSCMSRRALKLLGRPFGHPAVARVCLGDVHEDIIDLAIRVGVGDVTHLSQGLYVWRSGA